MAWRRATLTSPPALLEGERASPGGQGQEDVPWHCSDLMTSEQGHPHLGQAKGDSGLSRGGRAGLGRGSVYLPRPLPDVLQELQQELLQVGLGQQAQPHVQASPAQQLHQVQEVCIGGGPGLSQGTQGQELVSREKPGQRRPSWQAGQAGGRPCEPLGPSAGPTGPQAAGDGPTVSAGC